MYQPALQLAVSSQTGVGSSADHILRDLSIGDAISNPTLSIGTPGLDAAREIGTYRSIGAKHRLQNQLGQCPLMYGILRS